MVNYTMSQTIAAMLYATGENSRIMANLLPELILEPELVPDAAGKSQKRWVEWGVEVRKNNKEGDDSGDNIKVVNIQIMEVLAYLGETEVWVKVLDQGFRIPSNKGVPDDTTKALKWMVSNFGAAFIVPLDNGKLMWVSPLMGLRLGDGGGGQLNLYAEVAYRWLLLVSSWRHHDDKLWQAEWKQWLSSHRAVIRQQLRGEEASEAKAGLVAKATRAKGAYSAKVGAWMARIPTVNEGKQNIKPGSVYISSESPLARLQGHTVFLWRNPVLVPQFLDVKVVGQPTVTCPEPCWETKKRILPNSKVFLHPLDPSLTGGDVDGDGMQLVSLEELIRWAIRNWHVIEAWPGLAEAIQHYFLED